MSTYAYLSYPHIHCTVSLLLKTCLSACTSSANRPSAIYTYTRSETHTEYFNVASYSCRLKFRRLLNLSSSRVSNADLKSVLILNPAHCNWQQPASLCQANQFLVKVSFTERASHNWSNPVTLRKLRIRYRKLGNFPSSNSSFGYTNGNVYANDKEAINVASLREKLQQRPKGPFRYQLETQPAEESFSLDR